MRTEEPRPVRLVDYRPYPFAVETTALDFDLQPAATRVKARLVLRRTGEGPLVLDGVRVRLVSVAVDGRALDASAYVLTPETLTIPDLPDSCVLETEVEIDPSANTALEGLYMSGGRFCTQCEAEGFRKITFYPDRPDVLSRFTVRVEADRRYERLLSNGNLQEHGDAGQGRRYAVWNDPFSKPCYPVRARRRRAGRAGGPLHHRVRPRRRPAHLRRPGHERAGRLRHGQPQARHALGRDRVRP